MNCPEKETLQRGCAEAWNQYEGAIKELGVTIASQFPRDVLAITKMIDPATRIGAFRLRWEHLRASHALSKHLVTHRC
jgi:hypothetical protein